MIYTIAKRLRYGIGLCAFIAAVAFSGNVLAVAAERARPAPVVTLKIWGASSELEQHAFLAGLVSMMELEKEWQGQTGMRPLSQSMIGSWAMGLDGMSIKSLQNAIDAYREKNPGDTNKLVLEVLWVNLVQPKIIAQAGAGSADKKMPQRVRRVLNSQK